MITSRDVTEAARASGFRSDVVEKVLRLCGMLARLDRHPITRGAWLLKGGTALNLLHLKVPRLSVDIDLNFVGAQGVDQMRKARPEFERALESVCEREGCTIKRAPSEHAGGKFRLRFTSVVGGSQNLEVDVSYVARVPLLGTERRPTLFPPTAYLARRQSHHPREKKTVRIPPFLHLFGPGTAFQRSLTRQRKNDLVQHRSHLVIEGK